MTDKPQYHRRLIKLKRTLVDGLDKLLYEEAGKLKTAVEGELLSDSEGARLLLSAGLIEKIRDDSSTRVEEIVYRATPKGINVYSSIYKRK